MLENTNIRQSVFVPLYCGGISGDSAFHGSPNPIEDRCIRSAVSRNRGVIDVILQDGASLIT